MTPHLNLSKDFFDQDKELIYGYENVKVARPPGFRPEEKSPRVRQSFPKSEHLFNK